MTNLQLMTRMYSITESLLLSLLLGEGHLAIAGFTEVLLHSFSLDFEGCAGLREEVQSTKLKICFQEHFTEASLIYFAGDLWGSGESKIPVFLRAPRNLSKAVVRRVVGWAAAAGVVERFKNEEYPESCPFLSLFATLRMVTRSMYGRRGFRPVSIHAREGECLESFCFNVDATAGEGRLASTTYSGT